MIYLEQGNIELALQMYKDLRKWDEAIKLAERRGYSDIESLQKEQMAFLLKAGQEEKAGQVLEARGDTDQAMTLYLKANQPTKAARLLLKLPHLMHDEELLSRVISALIDSGKLTFSISVRPKQFNRSTFCFELKNFTRWLETWLKE